MVRYFRPYGKKRGHRRTGSESTGRVALGSFFALLFLVGSWFFGSMMTFSIIPEWQVNQNFLPTTCRVLETRLKEEVVPGPPITDEKGATKTEKVYQPEIYIQYRVRDKDYLQWAHVEISGQLSRDEEAQKAIRDQFEIGKEYECWYNPSAPESVVMVRGNNWTHWLLLLIPISFMSMGGGGLAYVLFNWGRSKEQRSALTQKAVQLEFFERGALGQKTLYPTVPGAADHTNSPGTTLAYRLPLVASSMRLLVVIMVFTLIWNGITVNFAAIAVNGHLGDRPEWFLTLFLIPMGVIGGGLGYIFVRQFIRESGAGITRVEISDHPLLPGNSYEVALSQDGWVAPGSLRVFLLCEEEAAYQQGTNTRLERQRVYEEEIFSSDNLEAEEGLQFNVHCRLTIPPFAMHSFKAGHNRVLWKLSVREKLPNWPNFERVYPLVVYPAKIGASS